jgi:hypothetical protein
MEMCPYQMRYARGPRLADLDDMYLTGWIMGDDGPYGVQCPFGGYRASLHPDVCWRERAYGGMASVWSSPVRTTVTSCSTMTMYLADIDPVSPTRKTPHLHLERARESLNEDLSNSCLYSYLNANKTGFASRRGQHKELRRKSVRQVRGTSMAPSPSTINNSVFDITTNTGPEGNSLRCYRPGGRSTRLGFS